MLKSYTITAEGQTSNGNPLAQPFTVEVHEIINAKDGETTDTCVVAICAKNGSGNACAWDQLEARGFGGGRKGYTPARATTETGDATLAATLEVELEAIASGLWS